MKRDSKRGVVCIPFQFPPIASFLFVLLSTQFAFAQGDETEHRIDLEMVDAAVQWIEQEAPYLDAFVVLHEGKVVTENYYNGTGRNVPHDLQSATKTVTGLLTGIAIDRGIIRSLDQPLSELLPDHAALLTGDKAAITIRHLLEMTSGLKWVDFGPERSFEKQAAAEDSVAFILGEPLLTAPGEQWFYNTGSSHLLSAVLHYNTEGSTAEFAEDHLFGPLEFGKYQWGRHADGVHEGGWKLFLQPADMVKLGRLLLDDGVWRDQQIVSRKFIREATSQHNKTGWGASGYGLQMWVETDFGCNHLAGARGWGGQNILLSRDLHLVIVTTGSIRHPRETTAALRKLVQEYLVPAHD